MSSPVPSRPSSPSISHTSSTNPKSVALERSGSFRSSSPTHPTHPVRIEHQIPNHPHTHIHTIRSPVHSPSHDYQNYETMYEDDISPPSSMSAQILAPFLNAPVPSSFKTASTTSQASNTSNGQQSRGAAVRASALGSLSRSSSRSRGHRRKSINDDSLLTKEYMDLLGDGTVDQERMEKIRCLAQDRGIPGHVRKYIWPLLLSQCIRDRSREIETKELSDEQIAKISKRIRGELSRYHRRKNRRGLPSQPSSAVTPSTQAITPPHEQSSNPTSTNGSTSSSPTHSPPEPFIDATPVDLAVESTITSFLTVNPDIEYSPGMVYLALTLATWILLPTPPNPSLKNFDDPNLLLRDSFAGALSLFGQLPRLHPGPLPTTRHNSTLSLTSVTPQQSEAALFPATHRISKFLSTFRLVMPELASYFDDEGIGGWGDDWVGGWVGWFCAKELSGRGNDEIKARLWDIYFSYPRGLEGDEGGEGGGGPGEELHVFVCIALLKSCADALEVLEQSEIRTLLQQFPLVEDVEGILREAKRIKEQVAVAEKEEEEDYLARKSSGSRSGSEKAVSEKES